MLLGVGLGFWQQASGSEVRRFFFSLFLFFSTSLPNPPQCCCVLLRLQPLSSIVWAVGVGGLWLVVVVVIWRGCVGFLGRNFCFCCCCCCVVVVAAAAAIVVVVAVLVLVWHLLPL